VASKANRTAEGESKAPTQRLARHQQWGYHQQQRKEYEQLQMEMLEKMKAGGGGGDVLSSPYGRSLLSLAEVMPHITCLNPPNYGLFAIPDIA
jgi:hypothetical protein